MNKPTRLSWSDTIRLWEVKSILRVIGFVLTFAPVGILAVMVEPCSGAGSGKEYGPGMDTARLLRLHLATLFDSTSAVVVLVAGGLGIIVLLISLFVPE
jgi:hypothetical protein